MLRLSACVLRLDCEQIGTGIDGLREHDCPEKCNVRFGNICPQGGDYFLIFAILHDGCSNIYGFLNPQDIATMVFDPQIPSFFNGPDAAGQGRSRIDQAQLTSPHIMRHPHWVTQKDGVSQCRQRLQRLTGNFDWY
jgi:hypothetical protein